MGKLEDEDYRQTRSRFEAEALQVLKQLDEGNGRAEPIEDLIERVEIVVLATPIDAIIQILERHSGSLSTKTLVTDTGSVMTGVVEAAAKAAEAAGAEIAHPPMELPGHGTFAIYIQGGIHHGLWQD